MTERLRALFFWLHDQLEFLADTLERRAASRTVDAIVFSPVPEKRVS